VIWDDEEALYQFGEKDWSIWTELPYVVSLWEDTYKEYWGLDRTECPEGTDAAAWTEHKRQHEFAATMLKMIAALSVTGAAEDGRDLTLTKSQLKWIRDLLRAHSKSSLIRDRIGFLLAHEFTEQVSGATDRALRLLGIVIGRSLSDRASTYLARVVRLFIQGWEIETGIMCRSALEAALVDRLDGQFDGDVEPPKLIELIRLAGEQRVLGGFELANNKRGWRGRTNTGMWRALRIQRLGNYIVHEFPRFPEEAGEIRDAFEAVRELTLLVGELFPAPEFE